MSLYREIFPVDRSERYVQTEWAAGWAGAADGFGTTAEFVTKHRKGFGPQLDQVGVAVFYLQRHRTELILKGLLEVFADEVPKTHDLEKLWNGCEAAIRPKDRATWSDFERHAELIAAIHLVDERSDAFRYPVDRKGVEVERPAFIDLEALNKHVEDLYWGAYGCIEHLTEM